MPNGMLLRVALLVLSTCALGVPTAADDLFAPPWRGQDGTTYQDWRFDTDDNPAAPEEVDNPFGNPRAEVTVGYFGEGWFDWLPGLGSKTGFWDLGGEGGSIVARVPVGAGAARVLITSNPSRGSVVDQVVVDTSPVSGGRIGGDPPEEYDIPRVEIWVQVTYFVDITQPPTIQVPGGEYLGGDSEIVEGLGGACWMLELSIWQAPSPEPQPQVPETGPDHG
jgi:hypothetical protein